MQRSFSQQELVLVWQKATSVPGSNPGAYRRDTCGSWIAWKDYGNRNSQHGWEVDHIVSVASGGSDFLSNLRPLHWKNNARKSDGTLVCAVRG